MPADAAQPSLLRRAGASWRNLSREQRRCATAAALMVLSMFLPWYSKDTSAVTGAGLASQSSGKPAILVFTFVEAAIVLVCAALLVMFFARGERRGFHLPGGDGLIVTIAGGWCTFLVFYRFLDQPSGGVSKTIAYTYGLSWGIFFGLLAALFLTYSGTRLRAAHLNEPPLPAGVAPTTVAPQASRRRRGRPAPAPADQLSFEDEPQTTVAPDEPRPRRVRQRATPLGEPPRFEHGGRAEDDELPSPDPPEFRPRR